ncbi:hypothetical protein [Mesomycoplasma ovipneumoniae]|uniref:hypothetical protein n=1 Tax=Mesomycoplasma ovipneumoniae TaxID=29562 RepID=UPI0039F60260
MKKITWTPGLEKAIHIITAPIWVPIAIIGTILWFFVLPVLYQFLKFFIPLIIFGLIGGLILYYSLPH